ncbi:hypothetical protein CRG98_003241 [Punica granatum]|uniref:Uncharacterized protein n=1 Tax=Punica granatum TaxID=22663 RepID=A0A2I0L6I3_PUNGR|nr:hypothetical protein CRG98_003241 [Punica granatum]
MATTLILPELPFLSSVNPSRQSRRLGLSRRSISRLPLTGKYCHGQLRGRRVSAVREEDRIAEELSRFDSNGNGAARVSVAVSVEERERGATNGSLAKYVNGNGASTAAVQEVEVVEAKEDARKKRIEEIGEEEAWFKEKGRPQLEVH